MTGSFSMSIGLFRKKTLERQDNTRRAVILKLFTGIIRDTPVDTGRLRASWRCSVANPDLSNEPAGQRVGPDTAVAQVTAVATGSAPTDVAILSNSLDYVSRIEYEGWSHTKAPQGMVRRNIARFRQLLASEIRKVQ